MALAVIFVIKVVHVVGLASKEIHEVESMGRRAFREPEARELRSHPIYAEVPPCSHWPQPLSATSVCGPSSDFTAKDIWKDAIKPQLHRFC